MKRMFHPDPNKSSHKSVSRDHPVEQIFDDIQTGRITRSKNRLANFCEYSCISSIKTMKVEETVDVKFDESNGSQVEQFPTDVGENIPQKQYKTCLLARFAQRR